MQFNVETVVSGTCGALPCFSRRVKACCCASLSSLWNPRAPRHGLGTTGLSIQGSAKPGPASFPWLSFDRNSSQSSLHVFTFSCWSLCSLIPVPPLSTSIRLSFGVGPNAASPGNQKPTAHCTWYVLLMHLSHYSRDRYLIAWGLSGSQIAGGRTEF